MKLITILFLSFLIIGCGSQKELAENEVLTEEITAKKGKLTSNWTQDTRTSPYNIISVSLSGNILTINVMYTGGCEKHNFDLIGSAFTAKSMPPKRGIKLIHHSVKDACRESITESLNFDISDFEYINGEIVLRLENYPDPIHYTAIKK